MKASGSPEMKEAEKVTVFNGVGGVMRFDMQNGDTFEVFGINTETGTCSARKRSKDSDGFGETVALNPRKRQSNRRKYPSVFYGCKKQNTKRAISILSLEKKISTICPAKKKCSKEQRKRQKKSDNK